MLIFNGLRAQDIYLKQLQAIEQQPITEVRGRQTKELLNVATVIERPQDMCILIPARRWNPFLALSESLWTLAGRNDLATLARYNKRITEFSDDGETLYGAYGYRIKDQLEPMIERLRRDPNDRRAVLSIWKPEDLTAETKDPPCNDMVMFKLRQRFLHMTVINRSNDIHWGLYAVNIPQFAVLQMYVAKSLKANLGTQTHFSNSLHTYVDSNPHNAITKRMLKDTRRLFYPASRWSCGPLRAACVLDGEDEDDWLCKYLAAYDTANKLPNGSPDWDLAARLWRG